MLETPTIQDPRPLLDAIANSLVQVIPMMLQMPVQVEPPQPIEAHQQADVTCLVGLSGDVVGAVALSLDRETATRIASLLAGAEVLPDSADFADALGELVNIVAGNAKAQFGQRHAMLSCPSVFVGAQHQWLNSATQIAWTMPCVCDCGDFWAHLILKTPRQA